MPKSSNPFFKVISIIGGVREAQKILQDERDEAPRNEVNTPLPGPGEEKASASAPDGSGHNGDLSNVHGWFGYLKELFTRFGADFCAAWAASLSFFAILSIVPVVLCALAVLGFIIQSPEQATDYVQNVVTNMLPGGATQDAAVEQLFGGKGDPNNKDATGKPPAINVGAQAEALMKSRGVTGIIGILSLFWSSLQIFLNASTPMNAAFRTKETRGFVKLRFVCLLLLFGAGFLFLLSLIPAAGARYFNGYAEGHLFSWAKPAASKIVAFVAFIAGVAINAVMYSVIYRFLPSPSAGINRREAVFAGGIVAVLSEAAKVAFAFYLTKFGAQGYNKLYGSLGGLIALIFWIYYSSMILLLGAEIAKLYSDVRDAKQRKANLLQ